MTAGKSVMGMKVIGVLATVLLYVLATRGRYLTIQRREWVENPSPTVMDGDVECFTEYMELWLHRTRIEGLRLWLSGTLRFPVSLVLLEDLNLKLSACGFSLRRDSERNYIFRVLYSGCFVHLEHGNYIMSLNLLRRINRYGGRSNGFLMKCPMVTKPPSGEHILCDPDFIQVTRQIPTDNWNNKLPWSLALRGELVVALEDASLICLNVETSGSNVTVQARRNEILRSEMEMDKPEEQLPLRLVSGHYSYSMEAVCPNVSSSVPDKTLLHVLKRRMGLVKRGGLERDTLTVSSVSVSQTEAFSVLESSDYVTLTINTSSIMRTKSCLGPTGGRLVQPFFRVDAVLTFKESPYSLVWCLENFYPCIEPSMDKVSTSPPPAPTTPYATPTEVVLPTSSPPLGPKWLNLHKFKWATHTPVHRFSELTPPGTGPVSPSELPSNSVEISQDIWGNPNIEALVFDTEPTGVPSIHTPLTPIPIEYTGAFLNGVPKLISKHPISDSPLFRFGALLGSPRAELKDQSAHTAAASVWGTGVMDSTGGVPTESVGRVPSQSAMVHKDEDTEGLSSGNPPQISVMKGEGAAVVSNPQHELLSPFDVTPESVPRIYNSTDEDRLPNRGLVNTTSSSLHKTEAEGTSDTNADLPTPSMSGPPVPSPSGYVPPMPSVYVTFTDHAQHSTEADLSMTSPSTEPLSPGLKSSDAHWASLSESSPSSRRTSANPTHESLPWMTHTWQDVQSTVFQKSTTSWANSELLSPVQMKA